MNSNLFYGVTPWFYALADGALVVLVIVRYGRSYWGRVLAVGAGLGLFCTLAWRVLFLLEKFRDGWAIGVNSVISVLSLYGAALITLAVASLPRMPVLSGADAGRAAESPPVMAAAGRVQNPWLLALLVMVTVNIYWVVWLHRMVKEIRRTAPELLRFTPGQAVGYLFIPLFNIYWLGRIFIAVPRAIGHLDRQRCQPSADGTYAGVIVSLYLLVGFAFNALAVQHYAFFAVGELLFLTALAYTQRHVNRLWRAAASAGPPAA